MDGAARRMRVISKKVLREFWVLNPQAEGPLAAWYDAISAHEWRNLAELRQLSRTVDYVGGDRYVFNICGNSFRIVVRIDFKSQLTFVRFIGTHNEYDRINDISSI